jgi:hypothetical protein
LRGELLGGGGCPRERGHETWRGHIFWYIRGMLRSGIIVMLLLIPTLACDPAPTHTPPPGKPTAYSADLEPISQLAPSRVTHLAADAVGNIYWSQQTPDEQDAMFIMGPGGVPNVTGLTSARILQQLGVTNGGGGTIQSIAAGPDGAIYFYFLGGIGRTTHACLGRYRAGNDELRILADTSGLGRDTGMGASIALARGQIIPGSSQLTLVVRHSDIAAILRFPPQAAAGNAKVALRRPFVQVVAADEVLDLRQQHYELAPGPGGTMLMTDTWSGALWEIDENGVASVVHSLVGVPRELSRPAALRGGETVLFAGDAEPMHPRVLERSEPLPLQPLFPALLMWTNQRLFQIAGDDLRVPAGFATDTLHLHDLLPLPRGGGLIAYDSTSGQVLRIQITPKAFQR